MRLWQKGLAAVAATGTVVFFFFSVDVRPREEYVPEPIAISAADTTPLPPDAYGIPMSGYSMEQGKVRPGDTFGGLLTSRGVDMSSIQGLVELASDHFDVRKMRAGYP